MLLEAKMPLTRQQFRDIENHLSDNASKYEKKGLFSKQTEKVPESDSFISDEYINGNESRILAIKDIHTKYKNHDDSLQKKVKAALDVVQYMKEGGNKIPNGLDEVKQTGKFYNDALTNALNRRLLKKLDEIPDEMKADADSENYAQTVERFRRINAIEAAVNLKVECSSATLPFAYSEAELKVYLFSAVPPMALASVKRIQFRAMTQEEDEDDDTLGLRRWSDELGGSEIIISDAKIREHFKNYLELFGDDPDAELYAQVSARNRMLRTISHEFGHALHMSLPPLSNGKGSVQPTRRILLHMSKIVTTVITCTAIGKTLRIRWHFLLTDLKF